jgi:hypothetical protein
VVAVAVPGAVTAVGETGRRAPPVRGRRFADPAVRAAGHAARPVHALVELFAAQATKIIVHHSS